MRRPFDALFFRLRCASPKNQYACGRRFAGALLNKGSDPIFFRSRRLRRRTACFASAACAARGDAASRWRRSAGTRRRRLRLGVDVGQVHARGASGSVSAKTSPPPITIRPSSPASARASSTWRTASMPAKGTRPAARQHQVAPAGQRAAERLGGLAAHQHRLPERERLEAAQVVGQVPGQGAVAPDRVAAIERAHQHQRRGRAQNGCRQRLAELALVGEGPVAAVLDVGDAPAALVARQQHGVLPAHRRARLRRSASTWSRARLSPLTSVPAGGRPRPTPSNRLLNRSPSTSGGFSSGLLGHVNAPGARAPHPSPPPAAGTGRRDRPSSRPRPAGRCGPGAGACRRNR